MEKFDDAHGCNMKLGLCDAVDGMMRRRVSRIERRARPLSRGARPEETSRRREFKLTLIDVERSRHK